MAIRSIFLSIVFFAVCCANAKAYEKKPDPELARAEVLVLGSFGDPDGTLELPISMFINGVMTRMLRFDIDGGGVGASDYILMNKRSQANGRAAQITKWLELDLNGDGQVTDQEKVDRLQAAEILKFYRDPPIAPSEEQLKAIRERILATDEPPDTDGDGISTLEEMLWDLQQRFPDTNEEPDILSFGKLTYWVFDVNEDGVASYSELRAVVDSIVKEYDLNRNGIVEKSEAVLYAKEKKRARRLLREWYRSDPVGWGENCVLPKFDAKTQVSVIGFDSGTAFSTVDLTNGTGVTSFAEVRVDHSRRVLVLITRDPVVLNLTGRVERLKKVIVFGGPVAVFGAFEPDLIHLADPDKCPLKPSDVSKARQSLTRKRLSSSMGGVLIHAMEKYKEIGLLTVRRKNELGPRHVRKVDVDLEGDAGTIWRRFLRSYPGGLVHVKLGTLTTNTQARPYKVFPREAGLATAIEQGTLSIVDAGEIDGAKQLSGGAVQVGTTLALGMGPGSTLIDGRKQYKRDHFGRWWGGEMPIYKISNGFEFPLGLDGIHRAEFLLPKGVEPPKGDPASSIITEVD